MPISRRPSAVSLLTLTTTLKVADEEKLLSQLTHVLAPVLVMLMCGSGLGAYPTAGCTLCLLA